MTHQLLSLLVPTLVLATACSDGGGYDTASSFIEDQAEVQCNKLFSCMSTYPNSPASFSTNFGASESACVAMVSPTDAVLAAIDASVLAGRITFNSADASTCTAGVSNVTCEALWEEDPVITFGERPTCYTAILGTVPVGGTCTIVTVNGEPLDIGDCAMWGVNVCDSTTMKCVRDIQATR